jgi:exopolysaccharide biosynthesis WecB/TagA/CpsF family protein
MKMTLSETRIMLGGSAVDLLDMQDTLDRISAHFTDRTAAPLAVVSVNLDHVHHFGTGSGLAGTLDRSRAGEAAGAVEWLNLIDGAPLAAHARRLTGQPWPRLAGSDLIEPILMRAGLAGVRVGFLGGSEITHQRLRSEFALAWPNLRVVGYWSPPREVVSDPESSARLAAEIKEAQVDLLVVGLGKPRQELWIAEHGVETGATVLLAFGAVVDFLAGQIRRAPRWLTEHGLEWAWRLALEPKRLASRYLLDGPAAYLLVRRTSKSDAGLVAKRTSRIGAAPQPAMEVDPPRITHTGSPLGAIIIPAHNEAAVIERTLGPLAELAALGRVEIIVVCNGCTDATAALARTFTGVIVHETRTASKTSAMNIGDEMAHSWPRLYLDADIEIDPATVLDLFDSLRAGSILAARPAFAYDTSGASYPVRSYYRARMRITGTTEALWGAGGYGLTAAGHNRFGRFPELTADDAFVDALFTRTEKQVLPTAPTRVRTPRHTAALLAVLTRQRRGVVELGARSVATERSLSLLRSVRRPSDALDACWYAALTATARVQSQWASQMSHQVWERDSSSRAVAPRSIPVRPLSGASPSFSSRASLFVVEDEQYSES